MSDKEQNKNTPLLKILLLAGGSLLVLSLLAGCDSPTTPDAMAPADYEPLPIPGWPVSTPEEQGLDPLLVADFIDALPGS